MNKTIILSEAEIMTIQTACVSFLDELNSEGLGNDEHGKKMTELYQLRIKEILEKLKKD